MLHVLLFQVTMQCLPNLLANLNNFLSQRAAGTLKKCTLHTKNCLPLRSFLHALLLSVSPNSNFSYTRQHPRDYEAPYIYIESSPAFRRFQFFLCLVSRFGSSQTMLTTCLGSLLSPTLAEPTTNSKQTSRTQHLPSPA